jgi:hypothetical protein
MTRSIAAPVTLALALLIAGCVAIPSKDEPAAYAQALVQDAIRLYNREGRQAAVAHYSSKKTLTGNGTSSLSAKMDIPSHTTGPQS